jgi:hypothetical protein
MTPLLLQPSECGAAGDAKRPRSKQCWVFKPSQFSIDQDEDVLQDVVGVTGAGQAREISTQRPLHTAKKQFHRFAVIALSS